MNERLAKILNRLADEERQRKQRRDEQARSRGQTGEEEDGRDTTTYEISQGGRRQDSASTLATCEDANFDEQDFRNNTEEAEYIEPCPGSGAGGRNQDHGIRSSKSSSRPSTPVRDRDPNLDPGNIPPWLLSIEQNCDLRRVCDPVSISSISRNYGAPRRRTDWYTLEGKFFFFLNPRLSVGSDANGLILDVLGVYLGPGAERVLDDEQVMEGFSRVCEEAGISSGLLKAWIELEEAAM